MHPLILALSFIAVSSVSGHAAPVQPNVILIVTDDQGYGDMACHGNPWLQTPNLDRLHAQSVCLEDYHVDPVCTPTRAALMTGRYCTRVGAWAVTEGRQLLDPHETTMAQVFEASGYRTGMFGKWHLGDPYPFAPQHRGFQDVVYHRAGGVDEIGNPVGNDYFDDTYFRNGKPEKFNGYCTDVWFNEAVRFIRVGGQPPNEKPFFLYLPCNAMHSPHTVAERYSAPYIAQGIPKERAIFFGMIANFDENLGRLLGALHESGLERDTILIFMGDNGTAAGGGGKPNDGFNAGMRGKKGSIYEGGHRVGCFIRWPARFNVARQVAQLTAHRDWLPTLIELCGLKAPPGVTFDGRSIAPLLEGTAKDWPERTLFVERQADQLVKWNGNTNEVLCPQSAVLTEKWRLANGELYDILADPAQRHNVAARHADVVKRLLAAHEEWFADVTRHGGAYTRFLIGAPVEDPTTFTVRDWHPTAGQVIWHPEQLSDDALFINGFSAVHAARSGRYAIRLARYPADAEKPMGASAARIKIDNIEQTRTIAEDACSATFELELKEGPALFQTWLMDAASGNERGAYHVTASFLGATK